MKFLIALFALVAVASAKNNYVFKGDHGYHQQSFNIQGGGASAVAAGGRGRGGYSSGGYSSGSYGGAALGGNVQLVALVPVQAQHTNIQSHASVASHSAQSSGPIYAAVQSTRNVQFVDGPSAEPAQAQTIIIGPSVQPLDFEFQSQSSPINVRQSHIPGQPGAPQESSHTEEPDVLRQTITKPLIHEVHEEITPVRRISQVVNPVQEEINQQITRGQQVQQHQQVRAQHQQVQAVQAIPVQTVQVAAVQPAQQQVGTIAIIGGLQGLQGLSGGYSGLSGLSGLSGGSSGYSSGYSSGGLTGSFGNAFRGLN